MEKELLPAECQNFPTVNNFCIAASFFFCDFVSFKNRLSCAAAVLNLGAVLRNIVC